MVAGTAEPSGGADALVAQMKPRIRAAFGLGEADAIAVNEIGAEKPRVQGLEAGHAPVFPAGGCHCRSGPAAGAPA